MTDNEFAMLRRRTHACRDDAAPAGRPSRAIRRRFVRGLLLVTLCMAGCDNGASAPPTTQPAGLTRRSQSGYIAFVGAGEQDPIWPILRRSATEYSRLFGSIEVRYVASKGDSPREQVELLRGLRDNALRGLCVQINDADAVRGVLGEIEARGVGIVPMVHEEGPAHPVGFSGLDEAAIGTALAHNTARILEGTGTIMVLHAGEANPIYGPRFAAFSKEIQRQHSIDIFGQFDCEGDPIRARQILREQTERFPRLSGWVSMDDWPIRGLSSDRQIGLPATCRLFTASTTPTAWKFMEEGRCPVLIAVDLKDVGARAVQFCETAIRRPSAFRSRHVAPIRVVEPAGLADYMADWQLWTGGTPASRPAPSTLP